MIQRIQTIYLLLTTITAILFLSGEIFLFENDTSVSLAGLSANGGSAVDLVFSALLLAVPLFSFIIIFLYKKRKLQLRLALVLILLVILLLVFCGYYIYQISGNADAGLVLNYKLALPVLMLVFSTLAYRGIRKDEEIVRSYDRLR